MWQVIIGNSLQRLDEFLKNSDWHGREKEMVNLYAHHFLNHEIKNDGPLTSLSQIGIEVAVPQITGSVKKYVHKDLVIWPRPLMTAWPDGSLPSVIIEWKCNKMAACGYDVKWLSEFTSFYPQIIGVSACGFISGARGVKWTIIENGKPNKKFSL